MPKSPVIAFNIDEENEIASISVDDKTYAFLYDFEAIQTFFLTRRFIPEIATMGMDPNNWSALIWSGLLHGEPELKLETVISWFNSVTIVELYRGAWDAWTLGQPKKVEEDEEKPGNPPSA